MNKNFLSHRVNAILLMATGALMLWGSWGKWIDTWIDFGDDLFIQWRIVHGAVLYRDIAYFRGPFPLYFNAALFKFFGTGILTLVVAQVLMIVLVAILTYRFFLETSGTIAAFLTSFVFLTMFAFSQYNGMGNLNFVCPYTYAMVDGYVFAMLGLFIFLQFIKNENTALLFLLGVVTGIIFLIKVEIFVAYFLAIVGGMILWGQSLRKPGQVSLIKGFFILLTGAMVPFGAFWFYFSQRMPWAHAFHALTLQYWPNADVAKDPFYLHTSGFDHPFYNVLQMFDKASCYFITVVLIAAFVFISDQAKIKRSLNGLKIFFLVLFGFALCRSFHPAFIMDIFRPLPLVVLVFSLWIKRELVQGKAVTPQRIGLCVFACFALLLLVRILLHVSINGYGFVLALPAVLILIVIMVQFLPKMIDGLFNGSEKPVCCVFLVLIGAVIFLSVYQSRISYSFRNLKITHGADEIISYNPEISGYGLQFKQALDFVNTQLGPQETFLVLPEGTLLNYLSRKDTGTHYFKFGPAEQDMWTEDAMLQDFQEHPPDYILYKLWRGFGQGPFGHKMLSWINTDYRQVQVFRSYDQMALIIVKRK